MDKRKIKAVIYYKDFLKLSDEQKKILSESQEVEYLISIKKEEYKKLSEGEKAKLYGFKRTEFEPLMVEIDAPEKIIELPHDDFKRLSEKQKQSILDSNSEQVEFLISIKNDVYEKLSAEEKKELEGFKRTEIEPLMVEIDAPEKIFELHPNPGITITENIQSFKNKHKKSSKPHCPKNMINKNFNSKKKGGR